MKDQIRKILLNLQEIKNINNWEFKKKLNYFIFFVLIWSLFVYIINGEWLYFIPFLIGDIIFWKTINYTFWKKREREKEKKKSTLRSWVDAIIFAVIAATLLRTFCIEAYTIPTPSMEKSLMVGDYLFVSKLSYGPRVPMTPLAFPLVHHTLPFTKESKSYLEWIKLPYYRMKGFGKVERNDCVVFNWPAEQRERPVDKKENYIKRCVGLPGDKIELKSGVLFINDKKEGEYTWMKKQRNYLLTTKSNMPIDRNNLYKEYDIYPQHIITLAENNPSQDNIYIIPMMKSAYLSLKKISRTTHSYIKNIQPTGSNTDLAKKIREKIPENAEIIIKNIGGEQNMFAPDSISTSGEVFMLDPQLKKKFKVNKDYLFLYRNNPHNKLSDIYEKFEEWTTEDYGPIKIPKKGKRIYLTLENLPIYKQIINRYENNKLEVKDGEILINGRIEKYYTPKMDYYWMMGDNRQNSLDSRFFGFVPEDHIVGKSLFIWMSYDENGKGIRWERMYKPWMWIGIIILLTMLLKFGIKQINRKTRI